MLNLSRSLFSLLFVVFLLLAGCGDDDSPTGSSGVIPTFYKTYNFGLYERLASLSQSPDGSIIVGGHAEVIIPIVGGSGADTGSQAIIAKIGPTGDTIWTTVFGIQTYSENVTGLASDGAGNFEALVRQSYIAGPGFDFNVQRFTGSGELGVSFQINDDQFDKAYGISPRSDGSFVLCGFQSSFGPFSNSFAMATNPDGTLDWSRRAPGSDSDFMLQQIIELPNNSLVSAGQYRTYGTTDPIYIKRMDSDGVDTFDSLYNIGGNNSVLDIAATGDSTYKLLVARGLSNGEFSIVWFDAADGIELIESSFPDSRVYFKSGRFLPDGGAILCGYYDAGATYVSQLIKLNSNGSIAWRREFADPNADVYLNAVIDFASGGYVIAGYRYLIDDKTYESILIRTDESGQIAGLD